MKKIFFLAILLGLPGFIFAQTKIILHYQLSQNINGKKSNSQLEQYYQNGNSFERPVIDQNLKGDTTYEGLNTNIKIVIKVDRKKLPFVLKSPSSNSLIYGKGIWTNPPNLVMDTLNNFKWTVLKETKNIGDVVCTKAETYFRGRNYIAWFKKDKNIQTGPWKFGGLPGIIYEVKDTDDHFIYTLENLEIVDQFPIELKIPEGFKDEEMITHEKFMKLWKANKAMLEKDNYKVEYTLTGSSSVKTYVAPLEELY